MSLPEKIKNTAPSKSSYPQLSESDKDFIREYISKSGSEEEKKERRKECSDQFGVSIPTISAITAWSTIWSNKRNKTGEKQIVKNSTSGKVSKIISLENLKNTVIPDISDIEGKETFNTKNKEELNISGEGMGALINYDNDIKNKWRERLKKFIDENAPLEKRKDMKILCLPGVRCLEIPMYIELGFLPENIIGVDTCIVKGKFDEKLKNTFEENAKKYGICYKIGKLEKILETEKTVFDIVSLDFLGPPSEMAEKILQNVKLSRIAIVMTNFQGRRENKFIDKLKKHLYINNKGGLYELYNINTINNMSVGEEIKNTSCDGVKDKITFSQEIMSLITINPNNPFEDLINTMLTKDNLEKARKNIPNLPEEDDETLKHRVKGNFYFALKEMSEKIFSPSFAKYFFTAVEILMAHHQFNRKLNKFENFRYKGDKGTPMLTDLFVFELRPESYYQEMRFLINFVKKYIVAHINWFILNDGNLPTMKISYSPDSPTIGLNGKIKYKRKDIIQLVEKGKVIAEITFGKVLYILDLQNKSIYGHDSDFEREKLCVD